MPDPQSLLVGLDRLLTVLALAGTAVLAVLGAVRRVPGLVLPMTILLAVGVLLSALPATAAPTIETVLVTVFALVTAVAGGDPVTGFVLARTTFTTEESRSGGIVSDDGRELLRGGRMIGLLERLAVAGVVIAGFPDALAVVIAIKGVGRFSELDSGAVRERFIVGTLVSWIWAAASACVVLLVRG